ncbi:MAG: RHS repeat-associated core domain-containing protein [Litorimonas sp.]
MAVFAAFSVPLTAQESPTGPSVESKDSSTTQSVDVPDGVNSEGSFQHRLSFDVPEFRDLVPNLGLVYNSSYKGLGSEQAITGVGWRLTGFSSIERMSVGRGSPSFDNQRDVFVLDGRELLACDDDQATNLYPTNRTYPERFKTDTSSASCLSGGNMSTQTESFRRVEVKSEAYQGRNITFFEVTNTKGTVYTYRSIGVLAGDSLTVNGGVNNIGDDAHNLLFRRKYLLAEIRDTQTQPNIVSIEYDFDNISRGRVHRPRFVRYADYEVEFQYEWFDEPLASFAIGSLTRLGQVHSRLQSVQVRNGPQKVRAYQLNYERSPVVKAHRLTGVEAFGSDYQLSSGAISSGSQLPPLLRDVTYASDGITLQRQSFSADNFHCSHQILDLDQDNKPEIILLPGGNPQVNLETSQPGCSVVKGTAALELSVERTSTGTWELNSAPAESVWTTPQNDQLGVVGTMGKIIPFSEQLGQHHAFWHETTYEWTIDGVSPAPFGHRSTTRGISPQTTPLSTNVPFITNSSGQYVVGNYDDDPEAEVAVEELNTFDFYDFDGSTWSLSHTITKPNGGSFGQPIDLDGDGTVEELFAGSIPYYHPYNSNSGWVIADHWNDDVTITSSGSAAQFDVPSSLFAWGDLNGDGKTDRVYVQNQSWSHSNGRGVHVVLSTGKGFLPKQQWLNVLESPSLAAVYAEGFGRALTTSTPGRVILRDINGDGMDDLLIHAGQNIPLPQAPDDPTIPTPAPFNSKNVHVFLSTGSGFAEQTAQTITKVDDFLNIGDFDGNGMVDFLALSENESAIEFNVGAEAHLLTQFTDVLGATSSVLYAPSTDYAENSNNNNNVPEVSQVVASINVTDGHGQARVTSFSYVNSKYDYENRRSLGFGTVTATLPELSAGLQTQLVTVYENDHIGSAGRVKSQIFMEDGVTYQATYNDWGANNAIIGPFRVDLQSKRTRVNYAGQLLETKKEYDFDEFGQLRVERSLGFTSGNADLDLSDNSVLTYFYNRNIDAYIVSTPKRKRIQAGNNIDPERSEWQVFEEYYYDGAGSIQTVPTQGNVTKTRIWDGNISSENVVREVVSTAEYDNYGNVTVARDAKNNSTFFTYYPNNGNQFLDTQTDSAGHSTKTTWDFSCQTPASVQDINNNVTTSTYDVHCREIRMDFANGHWKATTYSNLGNSLLQNIETRQSTPNGPSSGSAYQLSREYINGFGEIYRTASSGTTSASDLISTRSEYDARGRLAWQSVPLPFADTADSATIAVNQKAYYSYDQLGRSVEVTQPNGGKTTMEYAAHNIDVGLSSPVPHPRVITKDTHCYDNDAETICGETRATSDYRGNTIRVMKMDYDQTDVGTTAQGRETKYDFDLMDRLIGVTDPGGAQWSYAHDFKGNRLTADDPGLGFWTMEYDANDNLTKQYDAKGQTIEFTHDVLDRVLSKTVTWTDDTSATQTDVITYTYDEANPDLIGGSNVGQLTKLSGAHNTIRYGYDNAGNTVAEEHSVPLNGTTYEYNFTRDMHPSGALISQTLPTSSSGGTFTTPDFEYDAAGRLTKFGSWLTGTTYDIRSNPTLKTFGNGMTEQRVFDPQQGWIDEIRVLSTAGGTRELAKYWRSQAGRIERHRTWLVQDQYNYCYDYAGRLTVAADLISANKTCDTIGAWEGTELRDQFFSYRRDGSMASNSHVGDYIYSGSSVAHAPASVEGQALTYDANGNMTLGLNGKTMTYDGENRPLSVTLGVNTSGYVYGADGTRLMKLEQIGTQPQSTTLYVGGVEIRDPGANEVVLAYPHENMRLKFANANSTPEVSYLFRDHLNSVRMIADGNQAIEERSTYKPFGEENESVLAASKAQETIGWIGERHDAGAGLQYLNARYYDPELALFIQPDWFEVTETGVGTNRYSYSFNDPVNLSDPGGNSAWSDFWGGLGESLSDTGQAMRDSFNGNFTEVPGGSSDGGSYGITHVNGESFACSGCTGTGSDAENAVALAFARRGVAYADGSLRYKVVDVQQHRRAPKELIFRNPQLINSNASLKAISQRPEFLPRAWGLLKSSGINGPGRLMRENGQFLAIRASNGAWVEGTVAVGTISNVSFNSKGMQLSSKDTLVSIHTHPAARNPVAGGVFNRPSTTDLEAKVPGFVVSGTGDIWGYAGGKYQ